MGENFGDDVASSVHAVACKLLLESQRMGAELAQRIIERLPEFERLDAEALLVANCQANSAALLDGLIRDVALDAVAPTVEVRQLTREFAQRGVTLAAILRAHRIGAQIWTEQWSIAVMAHPQKVADKVAVAQVGTSFVLGWLDQFTEELTEEYLAESERLAQERSLAKIQAVRRVLSDPDIDPAVMSSRLGYDLAGRHVAFVLRHHGGGIDAAVRKLVATMGRARPLVVRVDAETTWCWVPFTGSMAKNLKPTDQLQAASGRPRPGIAGFRESHQEALAAMRVAEMAQLLPGTHTRFDHVAVAALCSSDVDACRTFVRTELGRLAANDAMTVQLRDTLESFFERNSNFRATAVALGIHHNTVRYRIERVAQLLGYQPADRRLALELALHLAVRLGAWVLEAED